ncbi:MAG TPA: hypothetical protein VKZ48_04955 [Burkholderiales bacterium]|nr:hypothetical protein [Burkholderiales bacterium]
MEPQRPPQIPSRIIERPDGFYWRDDSDLEYGPFATLSEALHDMELSGDVEAETPDFESLEEVEAELGVGWIDPSTGEPGGEGAPRLEDH